MNGVMSFPAQHRTILEAILHGFGHLSLLAVAIAVIRIGAPPGAAAGWKSDHCDDVVIERLQRFGLGVRVLPLLVCQTNRLGAVPLDSHVHIGLTIPAHSSAVATHAAAAATHSTTAHSTTANTTTTHTASAAAIAAVVARTIPALGIAQLGLL